MYYCRFINSCLFYFFCVDKKYIKYLYTLYDFMTFEFILFIVIIFIWFSETNNMYYYNNVF